MASASSFRAGSYRTGDYWLIPARTATGELEWPPYEVPNLNPQPQPRLGIEHHYCRLALIRVQDGVIDKDVTDCRQIFPPLTELTAAGAKPALHVVKINWENDSPLDSKVFQEAGLRITLDGPPDPASISNETVIVTIELPYVSGDHGEPPLPAAGGPCWGRWAWIRPTRTPSCGGMSSRRPAGAQRRRGADDRPHRAAGSPRPPRPRKALPGAGDAQRSRDLEPGGQPAALPGRAGVRPAGRGREQPGAHLADLPFGRRRACQRLRELALHRRTEAATRRCRCRRSPSSASLRARASRSAAPASSPSRATRRSRWGSRPGSR